MEKKTRILPARWGGLTEATCIIVRFGGNAFLSCLLICTPDDFGNALENCLVAAALLKVSVGLTSLERMSEALVVAIFCL